MTRADLVDVLKRLRFDVDERCVIWLDRSVRDFLVKALTGSKRTPEKGGYSSLSVLPSVLQQR